MTTLLTIYRDLSKLIGDDGVCDITLNHTNKTLLACLTDIQTDLLQHIRTSKENITTNNKLTKNQLALLEEILMQHCEDCDSSKTTAAMVDRIWQKILIQNDASVEVSHA